jgi:hypothetical protein
MYQIIFVPQKGGSDIVNNLDDLIKNGIDFYTADAMVKAYSEKIGTMNGIYLISDINYDFESRGKLVTLKCSLCGKEITRTMISGRNKWSELIKTCSCEKELKRLAISKNSEKVKREKINLIVSRVGEKFGDYDIISVEDLENTPKYVLKCLECGYERTVSANSFERITDFKCHKHYIQLVKYDESYIGRKNNFLKVIGITKIENNQKRFICQCDCGEIKLIQPCLWENSTIKSCGCKTIELLRIANTFLVHNDELDRLRRIYNGMTQRCYNPNSTNYANYGARGISICNEWLDSRDLFIIWALENGYSNDLSIDRIDVNGNYEPSNCRWATWEVQASNRRPRKRCCS